MLFYKDKNIEHKNKTQNGWEIGTNKRMEKTYNNTFFSETTGLRTMPGLRQLPTLPNG